MSPGRRRLRTGNDGRDRPRLAGAPPSANGASSFHLWWQLPPGEPLVEVEATLTVMVAPVVDHLYFWALQTSFHDGSRHRGGGHLGLQWHPAYPGSAAANWGGYDDDGSELTGSVSVLPSAQGNPNTRDYRWEPGRPYRLRIARAKPGPGWRGEVVDLATGRRTVLRDLHGKGQYLSDPVMWSEVFARCDDPSVAVRWSDLAARTVDGTTVSPETVLLSFQSRDDGGCDNTGIDTDPDGVVQVTNAARPHPPGAVIPAH